MGDENDAENVEGGLFDAIEAAGDEPGCLARLWPMHGETPEVLGQMCPKVLLRQVHEEEQVQEVRKESLCCLVQEMCWSGCSLKQHFRELRRPVRSPKVGMV